MPFTAGEALALFKRAAGAGRLPHACLLAGPEGAGKRKIAGEVVRILLGSGTGCWPPPPHPDLHVISPESKSRRILTEQIRELEHLIHLRPSSAARKVGVILDADRLQLQAANAFLKTLEEPPPDSFLILATSNPAAMLSTILSRCITIALRPAAVEDGKLKGEVRALLEKHLGTGDVALPTVLGLVRGLEALFQERRESFQEEAEAQLKAEGKFWPEGMPSDVAKAVEAKLKASAESRYIAARGEVLDQIALWWLELARGAAGAGAAPAPSLAEKLGLRGILEFLDALEALRGQLDRNAHESLAIETAFLSLCDQN